MLRKWTQRDNFTIHTAHLLYHLRHQLFTHTLPFQARIHIGVLNDAQMLAGRDKDDLRYLIAFGVVDVKLVMAFKNFYGS